MRRPPALRIALRELRGGLAGFRVFLACLALGVAAIAAVGTVRAAIETGLNREAALLLGGDAVASFTYRRASDTERDWLAGHAEKLSEVIAFRSMARFEGEGGTRTQSLVQVKAVDDLYPLYGEVLLAGGGALKAALAGRDGLPGLVAEAILLNRYGLKPGDTLRLGTQDFVLMDGIERVPDDNAAGFSYGPQVIVTRTALEGSGLLSEGSLFDSHYRMALALDTDPGTLRREARAAFADQGLQWRDRRNGAPGVSAFVERLSAFLVLIGLAGLAVGGVGVSASVRAYLDRKTATIATLKTLGAGGGTIFTTYMIQIGILSVIGIALGLLLGGLVPLLAAPLIEARLTVPAIFRPYPGPLLEAALYGTLTALIFTFWPLARARDIRAAELFRDISTAQRKLPRPVYTSVVLGLAALLVAAAAWLTGAAVLTLYVAAGVTLALIALYLAGMGLRRVSRALAASRAVRGAPALRWALAATGGPSGETIAVVLSLGLGLTVLAAIGQIDSNLRSLVSRDLPARAPAYFFVDIQNPQLDGFLKTANAVAGVTEIETAPMLRGVITRVNGRPARDVVGGHWVLNGDRGVSYAATPPPGTALTEGAWWETDYSGPPVMSFAAEEAAEMGLALGDEITVNILGRDLTAEITSFREVRFENMGINFVMIVNPGALAGAPHTHIATVYADKTAEAPLLGRLTAEYPNITAIGVRDAIDRVSEALNGISAATRWGAAATLLTGFIVLIGAVAAGERARVYEAAVLKTLGASRARILASFALRSALTGAAAGIVALIGGVLAGWWVSESVMDADYAVAPVSALAIVLGGAAASLIAGLFFAWRPLGIRPVRVLRARE